MNRSRGGFSTPENIFLIGQQGFSNISDNCGVGVSMFDGESTGSYNDEVEIHALIDTDEIVKHRKAKIIVDIAPMNRFTRLFLSLLSKDERKLVKLLLEKKAVKQRHISKLLDFSKPKVTRVLSKLEQRNIVKRRKLGRTYMVALEDFPY